MADHDPGFAAARPLPFSQIPVIDAGGLAGGSDLREIASEIHDAATRVGFFYLDNHGIAPDVIEQAFATSRTFFALPEAEKETVAIDQTQRGWMRTGMATMEGAVTHDLKEVFFWGTELDAADPDIVAGKPLVAVNKWPHEVMASFRPGLMPYYDAVCTLARSVLSAIAVGFDRPADFFESRYQTPLARGQLVYYPPSDAQHEQASRYGAAAHTDFGVLTFLLQDANGGLQARNLDGDWIEAPPIPGTLVCNIGDLLQRWTNDRFVSTVHRVINRSGNPRYSIPVFFDPHTDAVIDPRDLGLPEGEEPKHRPVRAGEHIAGRNRKAFAQYRR